MLTPARPAARPFTAPRFVLRACGVVLVAAALVACGDLTGPDPRTQPGASRNVRTSTRAAATPRMREASQPDTTSAPKDSAAESGGGKLIWW